MLVQTFLLRLGVFEAEMRFELRQSKVAQGSVRKEGESRWARNGKSENGGSVVSRERRMM